MEYIVKGSKDFKVLIENGVVENEDMGGGKLISSSNGKYLYIQENGISEVELLEKNGKEIKIKFNNREYSFTIEDELDQTIRKLGLKKNQIHSENTVKSPMPGLIVEIKVEEGQTVNKGDVLLILEAMKMENTIKSSVDGVVKEIAVAEKQSVEKNQLLIRF